VIHTVLNVEVKTMLKSLWKNLEESGRKWKIITTFVPDSVKEQQN